MSGWESWVIGISVGFVAVALVVLMIFLIMTLVSLRKTLKKANKLLGELDGAVDPYLRVAGSVGGAIERRVCHECEEGGAKVEVANAVADLAIIGFSLWERMRRRRR